MFTGIVEELGTVASLETRAESAVLTLVGPSVAHGAKVGESICVNGVCLTVIDPSGERFSADVMQQTLSLTNLGQLQPGDRVNLERAMAADGRFDGHVVQGHIDGTTRIRAVEPAADWTVVTFDLPPDLARYFVAQGSVILDGISLTISALDEATFQVSLIPTTRELTTLGHKSVGDSVNLEVDVLVKYVERILSLGSGRA